MKELFERVSERFERVAPDVFLLGLRLYFGLLFLIVGVGKLSDLEGTGAFFETLNLPAPTLAAVVAGATEALGGLALLVGLWARPAALLLVVTMVVAYFSAHGSEALLVSKPFAYGFSASVILVFGPGRLSLQARLAAPEPEVNAG